MTEDRGLQEREKAFAFPRFLAAHCRQPFRATGSEIKAYRLYVRLIDGETTLMRFVAVPPSALVVLLIATTPTFGLTVWLAAAP